MRRVQVHRTQHPIGQGGFHSSYLQFHGDRFGVVVDCGGSTIAHRGKLMDDFVDGEPLGHDWLVISHLDEDHINGVPDLEKRKITFSNVFLPHVNLPKYFLFTMLKMIGAREGDDSVLDAELASIVTIGKLYGGAYGRPLIVVRDGDDRPFLRGGMPDLIGDRRLEAPSTMLGASVREALEKARAGATFNAGTSIKMENIDWQFRFYSREWLCGPDIDDIWNLTAFAGLRSAMNNLAAFGTTGGNSFTAGITAALAGPVPLADANAALIFFDPLHPPLATQISVTKLLKKIYHLAPAIHDYNSASLCVYSGPLGRGNGIDRMWFSRQVQGITKGSDSYNPSRHRAAGWLGMGDAHLQTIKEMEDFRDHYRAELHLTSTVLLPHHGSRHNYTADFLTLHGLLDTLPMAPEPVLIAAADPGHLKYRHPHGEVVDIGNDYGAVHTVDLNRSSTFEEFIECTTEVRCPWY